MKSVAKALILATQGWMRPLYKDSNYKSISIKSAYHTQLSNSFETVLVQGVLSTVISPEWTVRVEALKRMGKI